MNVFDCGQADAAGARMQKHNLAALGPRGQERHVHRRPGSGQCARLLERKRLVNGRHESRVAASYGRESGEPVSKRSVSNLEMLDTGAPSRDVSGTVATGRAWVAGIGAEHIEHVAEVESDCTHVQPSLTRNRLRIRGHLRYDAQIAYCTAGIEMHADGSTERLRCLREARDAPLSRNDGELGLNQLASKRLRGSGLQRVRNRLPASGGNVETGDVGRRLLRPDSARQTEQAAMRRVHGLAEADWLGARAQDEHRQRACRELLAHKVERAIDDGQHTGASAGAGGQSHRQHDAAGHSGETRCNVCSGHRRADEWASGTLNGGCRPAAERDGGWLGGVARRHRVGRLPLRHVQVLMALLDRRGHRLEHLVHLDESRELDASLFTLALEDGAQLAEGGRVGGLPDREGQAQLALFGIRRKHDRRLQRAVEISRVHAGAMALRALLEKSVGDPSGAVGKELNERTESWAVLEAGAAESSVERADFTNGIACIAGAEDIGALERHVHRSRVTGRVRHLLAVLANAANLVTVGGHVQADRNLHARLQEEGALEHSTLGTTGACHHRRACHLEVSGGGEDDAASHDVVGNKSDERPIGGRGEGVLGRAIGSHGSRLEQWVRRLAPREFVAGKGEAWHGELIHRLRDRGLDDGVDNGATVAEGTYTADKVRRASGDIGQGRQLRREDACRALHRGQHVLVDNSQLGIRRRLRGAYADGESKQTRGAGGRLSMAAIGLD
eukprot:scaffold36275_cov154-Isochrysis_galbana.AAC.36